MVAVQRQRRCEGDMMVMGAAEFEGDSVLERLGDRFRLVFRPEGANGIEGQRRRQT